MQSLNSTIFKIIAVSLGVEIVNHLLFFTQFECVCVLMSTLTHSGIVQVKRSPPTHPPRPQVQRCPYTNELWIFFLSTMEINVYNLNDKLGEFALHTFFFGFFVFVCLFVFLFVCFFLRWLTTHVQLFARMIVITSQNLLDCALILLFSAWRAEDKQ